MLLDFAADDTEAGFRLHRIEVYNWGTFDQRISTLQLDGLNTLVTGENGSGKSTFIDALTTLLVPTQRIAYNRAAGAESKERDLRSYVLGFHRSEYNEATGASKPVALRQSKSSYSVILGVFRNTGFDQVVTVAQVFWPAEQGQPNRFFLLAEKDLSIVDHFRGFTTGIAHLKRQLRETGGELFEAFPPYGSRLRRLVGIQSDQALELFHQTVSMKAVGNLTDFVRAHMLDVQPVKQRLEHLIAHFDNLTSAHAAVMRAKRQVELLTPIAEGGDRYRAESTLREELERARHFLRPYVGRLKISFLKAELSRLDSDRLKADQVLSRARSIGTDARCRVDEVTADIAGSGGNELGRIDAQLVELASERDRRRAAARGFETSARIANVTVPTNETEFVDMAAVVSERRSQLEEERSSREDQAAIFGVTLKELRTQHALVTAELDNLRAQKGNIPLNAVQLRERVCADLEIDVSILPFAGELIRVREGEENWEGAAERLLHGFALSMLVPEQHYTALQRWVDEQHLGQRLVYYRIPARPRPNDEDLHRFSLRHKLDVREDLPPAAAAWLESELATRANVACCDTADQFMREPRAITVAGQIKGKQRHEKDDRFRINDRSRFVLGWSNESKIQTLSEELQHVESSAQRAAVSLTQVQTARTSSNEIADALAKLEVLTEFRQIDWSSVASTINDLERDRQALIATSDRLRELELLLVEAKRTYDTARDAIESALQRVGAINITIDRTQEELNDLAAEFDPTDTDTVSPEETAPETMARIASLLKEALPEPPKRIKHLVDAEALVRDLLTNEIDAVGKRLNRLGEKLVGRMKDFAREFPAESQELDASILSMPGHVEILDRLRADDLPRFETEFRELLNTNTLREIANFQQALHQERTNITERIDKINASLATIEYNKARYIALVTERTRDVEIIGFTDELRACTEGSLHMSDDPVAVERKFLQVQTIIERFRGRSNYADADRKWTNKVTDVRNWFTFAASERWRHDDTEHEHYSDSSGKSGGQKEKLAYTVLAASLAYQFGLELGETTSKSFRFVAIDEAFGRADTDATKFGLELFAKLHLQLLVVTPLQRISIIEPFVQRVGFVSMRDDRSSVANLTIQEYRKQREVSQR